MEKFLLIGNVNNINSGPGYIINTLKDYMDYNNIYYEIIDSSSSKVKTLYNLLKIIFKKNFVVNVHSFGYKVPLIVMIISKINKKNKYYLTLHGVSSIESRINKIKCDSNIEEKILKKFPNIICVSNFQKEVIKNLYNREKDVFVCYNGCNFYEKKYTKKSKIQKIINLVDAGGVSIRKNTLDALKLVNIMNKNGLKTRIEIFGKINDQKYYNECLEFIKEFSLEDYVTFEGMINRKELIKKYQNSTFVISLSKFDTFNMTLLEAMQTGTPIITKEQVGISEIIKNKNCGYILEKEENLVKIIKELTDKDYQKMSFNAFELSHNYTQETMVKEFFKIIELKEKKNEIY